MQHGCNKKIAGAPDQDAAKAERQRQRQRRQDAVECLEDAVRRARLSVERHRQLADHKALGKIYAKQIEPTVTLPLAIAELVLECARHRHRSRSDKRHRELAKAAVIHWAWQRQRELIDRDLMPPDDAEKQAAKDAKAALSKGKELGGLGLSLSWKTIQRMMQSSPEHLAGSVSDVD
jgi:hypothetical protein